MLSAINHQIQGIWPKKTTFTVNHIPDMAGKVVIVTGANRGIGKEIVLLEKNAKVYLAARNDGRAQKAIDDLFTLTGRKALFLKLDLSDLKAVKTAAQEFLSHETRLDVLFNNAGVMAPPKEDITADGFDLQFGINVLGHFFFTKQLLPILLRTASSSPTNTTRIVNLSSSLHAFRTTIQFDTLKDGPARRRKSVAWLYTQSKFANVVFALELARRYGKNGIVSTSVHPGAIETDLHSHMLGVARKQGKLLFANAERGALTPLYAGASAEGADFNGKYLVPWANIGAAQRDTQEQDIGTKLWDWMEEQVHDL
ncbi:NAD(P)-binding protein [Leucogyrophana mollusca]|uniref:NAD(P)-binding protein n=1 Tax=Leucogyrophana mollusca TaxID=85980 RepID=A0ACB8BEC3_9AGAM|nr:NAD(P)-binding protein [Leucogyrophana mollusca]